MNSGGVQDIPRAGAHVRFDKSEGRGSHDRITGDAGPSRASEEPLGARRSGQKQEVNLGPAPVGVPNVSVPCTAVLSIAAFAEGREAELELGGPSRAHRRPLALPSSSLAMVALAECSNSELQLASSRAGEAVFGNFFS